MNWTFSKCLQATLCGGVLEIMPSLHLACDARKMPVSPLPCRLHTETAGGHTIIERIHGRRTL